MTPRASTPRPIRRAPAARPPDLPAGMLRILTALRGYLHQLKPGAADLLALAWSDLWAERDGRRLAEEVLARLARPESARHLMIPPFDPRDSVGDSPAPASSPVVPLWSPPR
jgi:hypothetical protein